MIVGGGVAGASVAWHLARRGVRDVVVLDRGPASGTGSTGAATGGFRAQFASPIHVRLSLLSREKLKRFRDEVGCDPGYAQVGYLWLARSRNAMEALRSARRVQIAEGLGEAVEVDPDTIARLQPAIDRANIVGGAFCPTDGTIRPLAILDGYLRASLLLGARVRWSARVVGLARRPDGRITNVRTETESIGCDAVVNAAGAWAGGVARMAGVELPVEPLRRQVAMTVHCTSVSPDAPMTIYVEDGFHFRPRDGRVLIAFPTPGDPDDRFATTVEASWLAEVAILKENRIPALRGVPLDPAACWAGLYEMSPDRHAILGAAPGCPNLYLINGSSGHGVMHAPALGQLLAELIAEGTVSTLDIAPLRPGRFADGAALPVELL